MEELIWVGALVFVLGMWLLVASEWGVVTAVSDDGFVFRNWLRRSRVIPWTDVAESVQKFDSPLTRMVVSLRRRSRLQVHTSVSVLLHGDALEKTFLERLEKHALVTPINSFADLVRRRPPPRKDD